MCIPTAATSWNQPNFYCLLLGYPLRTKDNMPVVASEILPIGFGDFKRAYLDYRRRGIGIIRDNITNRVFAVVQMQNSVSYCITKRYSTDLTPTDRLIFEGGTLDIEAVFPDERKSRPAIMCTEQV